MSYTIRDLPLMERPRERLAAHSPSALSVPELLQILLGRGTKGQPIAVVVQALLSRFGSMQGVAAASLEQLSQVQGIGFAKACQILACVELSKRVIQSELALRDAGGSEPVKDPAYLARVVQTKIADYKKEHSVVISLDVRGRLIGIDTISVGILNANLVHPREVFSLALRRNAATIMLSHNHPSGDLEPSEADLDITKRLVAAGNIFGIPLLDHLIISKNSYLSFLEKNLM